MEFMLFENTSLLFTIMDDVLFGEGTPLLGINSCASDRVVVVEKVYVLTNIGNCNVFTGLNFLMYVHTERLNRELIIHILFSVLSTS